MVADEDTRVVTAPANRILVHLSYIILYYVILYYIILCHGYGIFLSIICINVVADEDTRVVTAPASRMLVHLNYIILYYVAGMVYFCPLSVLTWWRTRIRGW